MQHSVRKDNIGQKTCVKWIFSTNSLLIGFRNFIPFLKLFFFYDADDDDHNDESYYYIIKSIYVLKTVSRDWLVKDILQSK